MTSRVLCFRGCSEDRSRPILKAAVAELMGISATAQSVHSASGEVRLALVLSGGGLRGAGHVGVLQRLITHEIPIDIIVGSSAGAIIGAYYAAVGLTLEELVEDARQFRGRHLIAHSLNIRLRHRFNRILATQSGLIPARLAQLESASFERLHHGVRAIGIVCHDRGTRQPWYFSTGQNHGARLSDVVRASASIPYLFPSIAVDSECGSLQLTDGGITDCLPIAFAEQPPLSATHLIVSDCRWLSARAPEPVEHLVYIRPPLFTTGTVWAPSSTLAETVEQGARAVTDEMIERIRNWGYGAPDFLIPSTDGRSTADCLSTL